ncbi:MAG: hypothetical protein GX943_03675 [Candidatus Pacebacteria bacterium]|jgi:hypothetical protein|nr:hypothetical protein [Candidatus Paceibacterota bacterium]
MQEKSKKFVPYIFPLLAFAFVVFMFIRWYSNRVAEQGNGLLSSDLEIINLTQEEEESIILGTTDFSTVEMMAVGEASGEIRYQLLEEKLNFTVTANLPDSNEAFVVWLKEVEGDAKKKVFTLTYSKAGFIGSASVPAEVLPVEVVVSKESDLLLEDALLRGIIED